jgi:hypothetical protein
MPMKPPPAAARKSRFSRVFCELSTVHLPYAATGRQATARDVQASV